ncbi:hypothetical protein [Deinococcus multiflagellatus]|uniref:LTD domain-containing protein n=1 Tax=Deinococcus multiflagellatus TaxID=1656887 RepID=A0ABW1ZRK7_9DEIO|nr:hypothetical protein [Deinococcus multiflagellatus]MBZ9715270.1 hypothetical protein [Deinococcus multiflagellatus]
MKQLELQQLDGTLAPATDFGSVPPGTTTASRQLRLVNTGDEPVPGLRLRVLQDGAVPGEYLVSANGVALTAQWTSPLGDELLAPGDSVLIVEAWTTPAGTTQTGADHGRLIISYQR